MTKIVRLEKFSKELEKYAEKNMEVYRQTVIETLADNIAYLVANSPVDTGLFAQSWNLEVDEKIACLFRDGTGAVICSESVAFTLGILGVQFKRPFDFLRPDHIFGAVLEYKANYGKDIYHF